LAIPKIKTCRLLSKGIAARVRDVHTRPFFDLDETLSPYRGDDDHELLSIITKTAMQPASTLVSGWLSEIVGVVVSQFDSQLAPFSAFAQLRAQTLALQSPVGSLLACRAAARRRASTVRSPGKPARSLFAGCWLAGPR
jgi:hypothetical protein